jgi:hypothetical protein
MVSYYGDFAEDDTVLIPFNTFSSDDPSASVTVTDLADADIKVHKDGGTTEIATDGATVAINFDSVTGNHLITIDTSAHADYATGSEYAVRIEGVTVDGATINAWVGAFSIERAGGALAIAKLIQTAVITNAAGTDISADVAAVKVDTAATLLDTGTDGVVVAAASKTGYTLTATTGLGNQTANITGNLSGSVGSVTGAVGSVTGAVGSVTAEVSADVTKISGTAAAANNLEASANGIITGAAATGTLNTTTATTDLTGYSDDQLIGRTIIVTSCRWRGQ